MTISSAPARNEYTANASQTIFNYTFKIFENTDLNVYITPSGQDANDSADLTVGYTVAGLGDEDGGTITLAVGTNANDLVTIVSNVPSSRTTDYQNNGDFRPDTVNADFDRVVSIAKKIEDTANRTVLLQQSQQDPKPLSLPKPVAGELLRWKGDLKGLENLNIVASALVASGQLVIYPNVPAMEADVSGVLVSGINAMTQGYYSADDGNGAVYLIQPSGEGVDLQNSNVAIIQPVNNQVWLGQFGAQSGINSPEILEKFFKFCDDNNVTGRVKFPGYAFDFTGHTPVLTKISRLVGDRDSNGQKCRINITSIADTNFTCGDNMYIDAITFYSADADPTTKTLIERFTPMFQLELGDVVFKWEGDTTGAVRAKGFIRAQPKSFKFGTFLGVGVETAITIDSNPTQQCEKVQGGSLYLENFGTGLWCNGEPFAAGTTAPTGWFKDININYIAGVNTETQANNWFNKGGDPIPNGKDILLIGGYEKLHVGFVDSERAIERALYANTGVGPSTVGGYQLNHSGGIKIVGLTDFDNAVEVINKNITIGQGSSKGGTPADRDSFGRVVTLYDVEHVVVDTININGFETGTDRYMSTGVLLQNYCKDVHIKGVKGQITRDAPVVIDQKPNLGKDSYMEDVTIEGISMLNPSNASVRGLIHFARDVGMAAVYSMKNLRLIGNYGKSTTEFGITYNDFDSAGYAENSRLLGVIDCDWVNGLTIEGGNRIEGYRFLEGPYRIGPNCNRVKMDENIEVATVDFLLDANTDPTWPGPFYNVSNGSEVDFKMVESARTGFLYAKVLPVAADGDSDATQSMMPNSAIQLTFSVKLQSGQEYPLPIINGVDMGVSGTIIETGNGAFLDFRYFKVAGPTITVKDSAAFEVTPTGSTVSRFYDDSAGNLVLKNSTTGVRRYTASMVLSRTTS